MILLTLVFDIDVLPVENAVSTKISKINFSFNLKLQPNVMVALMYQFLCFVYIFISNCSNGHADQCFKKFYRLDNRLRYCSDLSVVRKPYTCVAKHVYKLFYPLGIVLKRHWFNFGHFSETNERIFPGCLSLSDFHE